MNYILIFVRQYTLYSGKPVVKPVFPNKGLADQPLTFSFEPSYHCKSLPQMTSKVLPPKTEAIVENLNLTPNPAKAGHEVKL
jgi:hypothetical protein